MNNDQQAIRQHPCFSAHAASTHSRVHLPVAKQCNVQCKYCNRKYDCVNESRPGVSSAVLSPKQALAYLDMYVERHGVPDVVGIAGPGDAFADADTTLSTLRLVKEAYPEVFLCVATNGLEAADHIQDLAAIGLSHCTITVNTFDPEIGARIYSWVRFNKHVYRGVEGAECLISQQRNAIQQCKEYGLTLKINSIVIPEINSRDIVNTAKECASLGASVINCMPLLPVTGSEFEDFSKPDHELMQTVRWNSAQHMRVVSHCGRCRADAAGLIGQDILKENIELLAVAQNFSLACDENKTRIAVATREGVLINQHLGSATELEVYSCKSGVVSLHSRRPVAASGGGDERWRELAHIIKDCHTLLVYRAGNSPRKILEEEGIRLCETQGSITEILEIAFAGKLIPALPVALPCGHGCGGNGGGCG